MFAKDRLCKRFIVAKDMLNVGPDALGRDSESANAGKKIKVCHRFF